MVYFVFLSFSLLGEKNTCSFRDDNPIINEVGLLGNHQPCFIEIQTSQNVSEALNSFILAIYSKAGTAGSPVHNLTFDLWNKRSDSNGYFLLRGMTDGSQNGSEACGQQFMEGTVVVVLYQVNLHFKVS